MEPQQIGQVVARVTEQIVLAPGRIPLSLSSIRNSPNWTSDELAILEAQGKGKKFIEMTDKEQLAGSIAVCLRMSQVSGCLLPKEEAKAKELYNSVSRFIIKNKRFRLLTASEVALAASWNAAGEFPERVKHWQQELNLDYVGELLNQYCRHVQRFGLKEKLERESIKYLPQEEYSDPNFWERTIEMFYQQFLTGNYRITLWPMSMFMKLADLGWIDYNLFVKYLPAAYRRVIDNMNQELKELKSQGKATHKLFEKAAYIDEHKYSNYDVLSTAKRFAIQSYFRFCMAKQVRNLFIEEPIKNTKEK